jgi:hypothetical protein
MNSHNWSFWNRNHMSNPSPCCYTWVALREDRSS